MPNKTDPKQRAIGSTVREDGWLDETPVGREFGSPDYVRLMELDQAAFAAFQSWGQVRAWLATPHIQLDGACPEDVARRPGGFKKVLEILRSSVISKNA